jgi:protein SCO1
MMSVLFAAALTLFDQDNRPVTLETFAGHPLVVSFVSAHCTDVCPIIDAQIARAVRRERAIGGPMRFLTITLDPRRDTHSVLRRLARIFDADERYWRIAGGSIDTVDAYMDRFGVRAAHDARGDATAHTSAVFVLDTTRNIAAALLPSSHLAEDIARVETQR